MSDLSEIHARAKEHISQLAFSEEYLDKIRHEMPIPQHFQCLVETAFNASLIPDETRYPSLKIAIVDKNQSLSGAHSATRFEDPPELSAKVLAQLAAAVAPASSLILAAMSTDRNAN